MNRILTFVLAVSITSLATAQNGFLRGQVIDGTTGEPLFGATVVKIGTTAGAVADFDGNYSIPLSPGSHTIAFQSVGFETTKKENIVIEEGKITVLNAVMTEDVQQLATVTVTAEVVRDNDIGMLLVQKKSINTVDGISSSTFKKVGDSNLSSAMGRVTGVSVQSGKYVYVRGLGDRYTKTAINGMIFPGLDPDRNDVQIDIFPTGILENVVVYKTFSPNLTGDFTGGLVDIQTKSFPDQKSSTLSLSLGFNPNMHFNSNYLKYSGSSTDFLGFDKGDRKLPVNPNEDIESNNANTKLFNPTLAAERTKSFMNSGFSFSHRNQIETGKLTWGYNAMLTYSNNINHLEGREVRRYERDITGEDVVLARDFTAVGDLSSNEVLWSGLISLAAKTKNHTIGTNFLRIQNGVNTALKQTRNNSSLNNPTLLYNDIVTYTDRSMFNNITHGKHQFGDFKVSWANSLIFSNQYEPDFRDTAINDDEGDLGFRNGGRINRFWRELDEVNESARLDVEYELNDRNKLIAGTTFSVKKREFDVYAYSYTNLSSSNVDSTDPNDLLQDDNIISDSRPNGLAIQNLGGQNLAYDGKQNGFAAYLMHETQIVEKLKSIYGVRLEKAKMLYSGVVEVDEVSGLDELLIDEEVLNETNLLPSLSLIYSLNDDMNLRASFNKTIARPSFKEKSGIVLQDPISTIFFSGNIDLRQSEINNYDLRWEYFFRPGELLSASLFFKDFTDHIALVAFDNAPNQIAPRNVGDAKAFGTEFEFRKRLAFFGSTFENFMFGSNLSFVYSRVDRKTVPVNKSGLSEYQSEVDYRNTDREVERYRNMSLQAPYSINTFFNYESEENGINANLSYNVQGETLTYVSASNVPEVYTRPFHSLNLQLSKSFGDDQNSSISLAAKNILNDSNELFYKLDNQERPFRLESPGRLFTLKYTYNF
jgi:outer membrane receptor protein involved in Fe transport